MPRVKDQNKIQAIYEATLALVLKSGYAELNMSAVAQEAGIATGTIYTYFKNKEDLINQLFLHLKEEKVKLMFKKYNAEDSFYVAFQKLWLAYFKISLEEYHKMMFIEQYAYSSIITSDTRKKTDALLLPMIHLLQQAQQAQLIKSVDSDIILSSITGAVLEIVRYYQNKGTKPSKLAIEQCFEMAWTSIRK
jgi:AcrR family transcriptional regulator